MLPQWTVVVLRWLLAEVRMCEEKFLPVPVQTSSRRDEEEVEEEWEKEDEEEVLKEELGEVWGQEEEEVEEEWEEPPETLEVDWTAISLMADQSDFSSPGVRR